ncbi:bifunctional phosphoglucose/phosphomannose isomerase [Candidatus Bathyarchaeota archaeon]|nr:bifunctional phosphoglucose/phosphomannose isomerase [Candidatus Bathyarchaeota archaeon]
MSTILDDLAKIKAVDKYDMCSIMLKLPEICEDAIKRAERLTIPNEVKITDDLTITYKKPKKILVVGMGGSAIGGDLLKDWLRETLSIPIDVCREYNLPAYADEETLVLVSSYSGNTEETLSMFLEALEKRCMTLSITSNGSLLDFNETLDLPFVKLPTGYPPRSAVPYLFFPLVTSLKKLGILSGVDDEIRETITVLKQVREEIKPENPALQNISKQIANGVQGSIPFICGSGFYRSIALRIKTQFNENGKTPAKSETFPELNHNETVGWTGLRELTKNFSVILIRDTQETLEISTRIDVTRKLVFDSGAKNVLEIYARGIAKLARLFSVMYIGDFASVYLGVLYGLDPTPVKIIDELKLQLSKRVNKAEELKNKFRDMLSN